MPDGYLLMLGYGREIYFLIPLKQQPFLYFKLFFITFHINRPIFALKGCYDFQGYYIQCLLTLKVTLKGSFYRKRLLPFS